MPRARQAAALKHYLIVNSLSLFAAAAAMVLIARSGGLSSLRLLLTLLTTALALAATGVAVLLHIRPARERSLAKSISVQVERLGLPLAILFIIFWCLTWLPPQYTGTAYYYFIGLYPLILCALLAIGSALLLFVIPQGRDTATWWRGYFSKRRPAVKSALIMLAAYALVAVLTAAFRVLSGGEPYWYGAGMPLLAYQAIIAAVIAALAYGLERWRGTSRFSADVVLFLLIWLIAAALWSSVPVPPSFWVTEPRPPNFESYPFSDAVTFDLGSQFALIGQGIYNRMFFDRALYMSFLVFLHTLGGQNYQQLMSIQAALFGVFPALLYLLGRRLHSRTAGVVLAALVIMRGITSLPASAWIDTATFKHMLTDFPTAMGVAVYLLLAIHWLESPRQRLNSLAWAAGVLGLTSLLRPHVLFILGFTLVLALWVYREQRKIAVGAGALSLVAFMFAILPWMTLGPSSGSLMMLYGQRVRDVIAQRYPAILPAVTPIPDAMQPLPAPVVHTTFPPPVAGAAIASPPPDPGPPFVVDHLLHNLVTSALIFPNTPQLLTIKSVVKQGEQFWRPHWNGAMSPISIVMLLISLASAAYGLGTAVHRDRARGLLPLVVLLLYLAANSFARTSGGRYLVPVDWILIAYFSIALAELTLAVRTFLMREPVPAASMALVDKPSRRGKPVTRPQSPRLPGLRLWCVLSALLALGALVPLAGVLYPARFTASDPGALLAGLRSHVPELDAAGDAQVFLGEPDAALLQGRILYPMYYRQGDGEPVRYAPYTARDYPRTAFMLIGPEGYVYVLLPGHRPTSLPNASEAIVLGCRYVEAGYNLVSAWAVAVPEKGIGVVRTPATPLQCPLPEPLCDNNGNCQ